MVNSGHNVESGGSCATMNITKTGDPSYATEGKDGGEMLQKHIRNIVGL